MKLKIYADGACSGNPGIMGIGIVIISEGSVLKSVSEKKGFGTNNRAEYLAIIRALEEAHRLKADDTVIFSDSQLIVSQLNKKYNIKSSELRNLAEKVYALSKNFKSIKFEWTSRAKNSDADTLAKEATKKKL